LRRLFSGIDSRRDDVGREQEKQEKIMSLSGSRKFPGQLTDKPDSVGLCMLILLPRALIISVVVGLRYGAGVGGVIRWRPR